MGRAILVEILYDRTGAVTRSLRAKAGLRVRKVALAIEVDAKKNIHPHWITGTLERGIRAEKVDEYNWFVTTGDTHYAGFVEWGTSRNRAYPFMTPAAESHRQDLLDGMTVDISDVCL